MCAVKYTNDSDDLPCSFLLNIRPLHLNNIYNELRKRNLPSTEYGSPPPAVVLS